MFTRYKGIEIPQNYSGSRFKSEPPLTETKTHKPSLTSTTRTSISPMFENALKNQFESNQVEEIIDSVSEFDQNDNTYIEEANENFDNLKDEFSSFENESSELSKGAMLLDEFKPFVSRILKSVNSEDILLLSLIVLLMSEGNSESNELIVPLLFLFLYR